MSSLDFLHGIETVEIEDGTTPIQTAKSSIIGLVGSAGTGPVNTVGLVTGSLTDGVNQYGVYADDGFTIPEALNGIFGQIGAMVLVVNVCDPLTHSTSIVGETVTFGQNTLATTANPYISANTFGATITCTATRASGVITLPAGILSVSGLHNAAGTTAYVLNTDYTVGTGANNNVITPKAGGAIINDTDGTNYVVSYTAALVSGVDYSLNSNTGTFTRAIGAKIMPQSTMTVSYTYVDPTKVTAGDIIGGVNANGVYTGMSALLSSETLWEVIPRILIAPHFMQQKANAVTANPVVANLLSVANSLKSIIFADGPSTTDAAVLQYVQDWGDPRIMVVEPFVEVAGPNGTGAFIPSSIVWAGVTAATDNAIGFWASPSNKEISGVIGVQRTIDFAYNNPNCRANYLNSVNVSVVIRKNGFRTWGNHSTSVDPNFTFLCVRRTADMIEDAIAVSTLWAVDRVIGAAFFTEVVNSVRAYLRYLSALGAIYPGGNCWIDPSVNTTEVIAAGQTYFDYAFTAPRPAEHITFRAHITDAYIANIFSDISQSLLTNTYPTAITSNTGISSGVAAGAASIGN